MILLKYKLVAVLMFSTISVITLLISGYMSSTKSVDLSEMTINNMKMNQSFNPTGFNENHNIQVDRYAFYYNDKHPNFVVKVDKANHKIKGMVVINDKNIETNMGFKVGDDITDVIQVLGSNYQLTEGKKGYKTLNYVDKEHHLKLKVLYQDDEIKRIEYFK
ncbi:hypothetical protein [Staphylococcus simulans]|uniref:hypothetical protein n=1 Tax=Staphylococcus simulans TaxID=1286 RepID=UPI001F5475A6|nr:hypothetical protein [Staphylococcus simulans]MDY5060120.1 hypothetical protein [Staphylococcus simulans]